MAQKPDPQAVALAALAQALADSGPKVMFGTAKVPSFFKGAAAPVKAAARLCEERQWLVATGEWVGTGKSRKQTYRLTPEGVKAVLAHSETTVLVRGLAASLRQQAESLSALRGQVDRHLGQLQPLEEAVQQLARKVEPPDVEQILKRLAAGDIRVTVPPSPPAPSAPTMDWLDDVVRLAAEQQQRDRYLPLDLPAIYAALKRTRPALSLGQFHDGLRTLRDQGRIRLTPFTRAHATISDPRNALFLDGEVMYYVQLP